MQMAVDQAENGDFQPGEGHPVAGGDGRFAHAQS
jgi:hypothetical protein